MGGGGGVTNLPPTMPQYKKIFLLPSGPCQELKNYDRVYYFVTMWVKMDNMR